MTCGPSSSPRADERPVYLWQVATVEFAPRVKRGDSGYMGKPAVVVSVEKQPNVDTIALTGRIEEAIAELGSNLPLGIKADQIVFRQANFIEASIRNLRSVLIEAAIVVAVVLFAFLLNWRTTAISLTAIPVSILATAVIFYFAGLSINTMTLGGIAIAIGALVDDAVVDVENIFRRLRENRAAGNPRSAFDVVVAASQEVRSGILYATAIIVLVFVPLFALSGIEGRLFTPLGQAYIIAILASLVVSITLTPVMAYYMLPGLKRLNEREGGWSAFSSGFTAARLSSRFEHGWAVIATTVAAVAMAGAAALLLPRAFLPPFNEGTLNIQSDVQSGGLAHRIRPRRADRRAPHARSAGGEVDRPPHRPRRTRRACRGHPHQRIRNRPQAVGRTKDEIVADIRSRLTLLPLSINVGQPISHRLDHMLSGVRADIAVKIFGEDLDALRNSAEELRSKLSRISGLTDLQVEKQVRIPQLEIRVDYRRAALYGVQPGAVVDRLSRLSSGRVVSRVVDG